MRAPLILVLLSGAANAQSSVPQPAAPPVTAAPAAVPSTLRVDINTGIAAPTPIAVPTFPTAAVVDTPAGDTANLGRQVAGIIAANLSGSGLFRTVGAAAVPVGVPEVTAPRFDTWRGFNAQALATGSVTANADGTLTVSCYLYDVFAGEELTRQGFTVSVNNWRRAAHKCSDLIYSRLTGETGYFDTRVVYVSEDGPRTKRIKRLAIMDQDGANHRFLTSGGSLVLTPRFAPNQQTITYMSFVNDRPRVWVYNVGSGRQQAVGTFGTMTFAPRFTPDGNTLLLSAMSGGNADIYAVNVNSGASRRLTQSGAIDTAPSASPDGGRIVFESDRSGAQQLYVMDAGGGGAQRISFGDGRAASPAWSPRGDLIAFTKISGGRFRIAVMRPDGGGERVLSDGWQDENPSWSPNGRVIMFSRTERNGRTGLRAIDVSGQAERAVPTPRQASDPAWSPLLP